MKALLWMVLVVLTLALAALAANFLLPDNGYVLINFRGYAIEMSVPVLAFLLILAYLAVRLVVQTWNAPRRPKPLPSISL